MIRDQLFTPNYKVAVGYEFLYDPNASKERAGVSLTRAQAFRQQVQSNVSHFDFWLLLEKSSALNFDPFRYAELLSNLGVEFREVIFFDLPAELTELNAVCDLADLVYAPSLIVTPGFVPLAKTSVSRTPDIFISALRRAVLSASGFERSEFRSWEMEANANVH